MIEDLGRRVRENVAHAIVGKDEVVELALAAVLAGGHVLLEDVPGTGKTMLARALAASLGLGFKRVQFTPDLLPTDVTGVSVYRGGSEPFVFQPGPVFTNILLADEINRATPKTQSALLEAMAEGQVTAEGRSLPLPEPFVVIATQNPVEMDGTYRLPEAQLDRFLVRLSIGYPGEAEEIEVLRRAGIEHPVHRLAAVSSGLELLTARHRVAGVRLEPELRAYAVALARATRALGEVHLGASPRASLALQGMARALAALSGRSYTTPDDVKRAALPVLGHRLGLRIEARLRGATPEGLVKRLLSSLPVPVEG